MKYSYQFLIVLTAFFVMMCAQAVWASDSCLQKADHDLLRKENTEAGIHELLNNNSTEEEWKKYAQSISIQSELLRQKGKLQESFFILDDAYERVKSKYNMHESKALIETNLAQSYFLAGKFSQSIEFLLEALERLDHAKNHRLTALILNELGNSTSALGEQIEAIEYYEESAVISMEAGDSRMAAKSLINGARAAEFIGQQSRSDNYIYEATTLLEESVDDYHKAMGLISIGEILVGRFEKSSRLEAFKLLKYADSVANKLNYPLLQSYAKGYIGKLYELEKRYSESEGFTRSALFKALEVDDPEASYLWQWQMGRLLSQGENSDQAIEYYQQAIGTLATLRQNLISAPVRRHISFRKHIGAVYYELADLLLKRANRSKETLSNEEYSADLIAARDTIEQLKTAEIEDYYQDECVTALEDKKVNLDRKLDSKTAIIYPIILSDRLELLIATTKNLTNVSVPVDEVTLVKEIRDFRLSLVDYWSGNYKRHAQRLFDWIVTPLENILEAHQIDTLVFVPDGALRTIPMSSLYGDDSFLIERYAVVSTPSLILTDPRPIQLVSPTILLNGLSQSVQGFDALPAVAKELDAIHELYGGKVLQNEQFISSAVREELAQTPYTLVHIATHGKIEADVRDSYLLTYDGKLTMDNLEDYVGYSRFRVAGVELLTLSACETAVGDDRAALGLAGIALKAGARSALATLWSISDEATAKLIPQFYSNLNEKEMSKAVALQKAQLSLLQTSEFQHPGFWSPFMLIGNWL